MTNGSHQKQNHEESQSSQDIVNDIQKNNNGSTKITIDAKTGKKRKRVELIQVRPPPQAFQTNQTKSSTTLTSSSPSSPTRNNATDSTTSSPHGHDLQHQRLLCTIASHSGSVLTLRFSSSGT